MVTSDAHHAFSFKGRCGGAPIREKVDGRGEHEAAWLETLRRAYPPSRRHIAAGAIVVAARSGAVADGIHAGKLEYAAVRDHSPDANGNFVVAFEIDDHECKRGLAEMLIFDTEVEHGKLKQPPQYNSDDDNARYLQDDFEWTAEGCKFVPHWRI